MKKIQSCLWFDGQAEAAAAFYASVFENSKVGRTVHYGEASALRSGQKSGTVMTVEVELAEASFLALNGGPHFKFSPSLSFFVSCESEREILEKWKKISTGGEVRMALDKYPWAEQYGWTTDQFGVDWQLILAPSAQKISPAFLFVQKLFGKGEEAINFYMSIFKDSKIESIARDEGTKTVMHCAFVLAGQSFVLMEGPGQHHHSFSPATSLVVRCETQDEIDFYWEKLSAGGQLSQCGWLQDKYGVSWQIVPTLLADLVSDPGKSDRVMAALLKMTKLDLAILKSVK